MNAVDKYISDLVAVDILNGKDNDDVVENVFVYWHKPTINTIISEIISQYWTHSLCITLYICTLFTMFTH